MLKGPWKEAETGRIELPDDDADVVNAYAEFLASGKIASQAKDDPLVNTDDPQAAEWRTLAELYVFGEKYQDDAFCNAVVSAMAALADQMVDIPPMRRTSSDATLSEVSLRFPELEDVDPEQELKLESWVRHNFEEVVELIYDGTPSGSPARKFMVALHVKQLKMPYWLKLENDTRHAEFARDLLQDLFNERWISRTPAELQRRAGKHAMFASREEWFKK